GELAQLVVDQRQQLGRGRRITGRGAVEQASDLGHGSRVYGPAGGGKSKRAAFLTTPPVEEHHSPLRLRLLNHLVPAPPGQDGLTGPGTAGAAFRHPTATRRRLSGGAAADARGRAGPLHGAGDRSCWGGEELVR